MGSDASLTCTVRGLKKDEIPVFTWQPSTGKDAVTKEPELDACGCYSVSSVLSGCAERWNNREKFTCTAKLPSQSDPLTATIVKEPIGELRCTLGSHMTFQAYMPASSL